MLYARTFIINIIIIVVVVVVEQILAYTTRFYDQFIFLHIHHWCCWCTYAASVTSKSPNVSAELNLCTKYNEMAWKLKRFKCFSRKIKFISISCSVRGDYRHVNISFYFNLALSRGIIEHNNTSIYSISFRSIVVGNFIFIRYASITLDLFIFSWLTQIKPTNKK